MVDVRILNYFKTIIDEGSFSKAAQALNMSQPPLTKQIKALETELGTELIARDTRNLSPTEAGRLLYRYTVKILEMLEDAKQDIALINAGKMGCLRIGCIDSLESYVVNNYLVKFLKENERTTFQFYTGDSNEVLRMMENHEVDLGIVRYPFSSEHFNSVTLTDDRFIIIVPSAFSHSDEPITIKELVSYPVLIHRRYMQLVKDCCARNGIDLVPFCISNDTTNIIKWSISGMGVAIVPFYSCTGLNDPSLHFREISDEGFSTKTAIIWDKDCRLSSVAMEFLRMVTGSSGEREAGIPPC